MEQLEDYIKNQLDRGVSKESIQGQLQQAGWKQDDIDAAFQGIAETKLVQTQEKASQKILLGYNLTNSIKDSISIIKFKKTMIEQLIDLEITPKFAEATILIICAIIGASEFMMSKEVISALLYFSVSLVFFFASFFIQHAVATAFGSKGKFSDYLRVIGIVPLPFFAIIILLPLVMISPIEGSVALGFLLFLVSLSIGIWYLLVMNNIIKIVYGLNAVKSIIVSILPFLPLLLLFI